MIKAPITLQELRRRIYLKAKADKAWRFWGLYVHVCKLETLSSLAAIGPCTHRRVPARRTTNDYSTSSSRSPGAEAPGRFSLRLGVYPSSQVLQIDGRLYHLAPASHVGEEVMNSRAPWLHGRYPASSLLRAPPPPSRLRPISREIPVIRPTLLQRFLGGTRTASPVAQRILVTVLPLPPRRSESTYRSGFADPCCLRSKAESSASGLIPVGATHGFTCVAAR